MRHQQRRDCLPTKRKEGRQAGKQARTAKLPEKENRKKLTKSNKESKQTERPRERERAREPSWLNFYAIDGCNGSCALQTSKQGPGILLAF